MKTISVRQPYATLICAGVKPIENRSWRTKFRGRIYIHAPAKSEVGDIVFSDDQLFDMKENNFSYDGLETSAIIGYVEIVDCIRDSKSIWAEYDFWHWVLKDPILFDDPILNVKGKLSLWDFQIPA